jgi:hypothetical protein
VGLLKILTAEVRSNISKANWLREVVGRGRETIEEAKERIT